MKLRADRFRLITSRSAKIGLAAFVSLGFAAFYHRLRYVNPYRLQLTELEIALPENCPELKGTTILFVSDLHAGPAMSREQLNSVTQLLGDRRYDLLLLGGDYVSASASFFDRIEPLLDDLRSRASIGTAAVIGNHDMSISSRKVTAVLERHELTVLRNQSVFFEINGARLWIAGIDDSLLGRPNVDQAFRSVPTGEAVIALWHEPAFASQIAEHGAFLQLSGHSHGGQIRLPGLFPFWAPPHGRKHISGLNDVDGMPVYTANGVGVFRPPLRFNCPPEITLVTLV